MLWLSIEILNNPNRAVSKYWMIFLIFKSAQILMRLVDYYPIVLKSSVECRQVVLKFYNDSKMYVKVTRHYVKQCQKIVQYLEI